MVRDGGAACLQQLMGNPGATSYADAMLAWENSVSAFEEAAAWFGRTVPASRETWDQVALGDWTIRDLVGHTSRALLTVESYLKKPPSPVEVTSAVDYFRIALASVGDPASVAQRGRDAGAALGDDLQSAVATVVARVTAQIRDAKATDIAVTPAGAMHLSQYLPTRTFELTVHTCDLAAALDQPMDVPETAARESLALVGGLAAGSADAAPLLLAATGRRSLPHGFTVL